MDQKEVHGEFREVIQLGPEEEAIRLWNGALEARERAPTSLSALCECLDLGIRAAEIHILRRLAEGRAQFPATIASQLEIPEAEVRIHRDAISESRSLEFTEMLDMLSEDALVCVAPQLHRGWEDRRFSCRRTRNTARTLVDLTLDDAQREQLLTLAAYRNRIFRYPPPVQIDRGQILDAFKTLTQLVDGFTTSP